MAVARAAYARWLRAFSASSHSCRSSLRLGPGGRAVALSDFPGIVIPLSLFSIAVGWAGAAEPPSTSLVKFGPDFSFAIFGSDFRVDK